MPVPRIDTGTIDVEFAKVTVDETATVPALVAGGANADSVLPRVEVKSVELGRPEMLPMMPDA